MYSILQGAQRFSLNSPIDGSLSSPGSVNKNRRCVVGSCGYTGGMMVRNMFGTIRNSWMVLAAAGCIAFIGCAKDAHLAGRKIPHVTVKAVTIDGVTLDQDAPPEAVAFAALQAIRDDFKAATPEERDAALARQFNLCAANVIEKHDRSSLGRDEFVYNVVYRWTPTVSHYVDDFPANQDEATERFVVRPVSENERIDSKTEEVAVAMEVTPLGGDERSQVVMMIWLAKDSGFWRVVHLGFDQQRRSLSEGVQQASARH